MFSGEEKIECGLAFPPIAEAMTRQRPKPVAFGFKTLTLGIFVFAMIGAWLIWNAKNESSASSQNETPPDAIVSVWPDSAKGKQLDVGLEYDTTNSTGELIAGSRVMRITNVSKAKLHVYLAEEKKNTGAAVVICPGGGFSILAWDLEGTEVAKWLNSIGVNAFVLKYRVPTRNLATPEEVPTEDLQRAIAMIRHNRKLWHIDPDRVGALGFSAGAVVAVRSGLAIGSYEKIDEIDQQSVLPNFLISLYAGRVMEENGGFGEGLLLTEKAPPIFLVHAYDDFVPVQNSLSLATAYKEADVPVEAHIYDAGGHGFGLRYVEELPITWWPERCEQWMRRNGWLNATQANGRSPDSNLR